MFSVPAGQIRSHVADTPGASLFAQVTLPHPGASSARTFRVIVGAPADATDIGPGSPYYAGTIGFFGGTMGGMNMSGNDATFTVPLPKTPTAFHNLAAAAANTSVNIRIVPAYGPAPKAPVLKALSIRSM
jgi:tyrosinase